MRCLGQEITKPTQCTVSCSQRGGQTSLPIQKTPSKPRAASIETIGDLIPALSIQNRLTF